jgi:beta-glucanase (GH16 family)
MEDGFFLHFIFKKLLLFMQQFFFKSGFIAAFFLISVSCKKSGVIPPPAPPPPPSLTVADASATRTVAASVIRFYLNLNKTSANTAAVDYTLIDETATSPADYTAGSGTVSIAPNQTQTIIEVPIKGNAQNLRQTNLQFTLQLSNPKFCSLANTSAKGIIVTEDGTYLPTDNTGYTTPSTYPGYTLVWSDEFSGSTLDANNWNQETGNGNGGWGNNELEYYTNSLKNTFVSNGNLIIEARKEPIGGFNYSSGRMTTQNKKTFKYGRIDIRAKLPVGKGIWPALWMLGSNISSVGWPACGEIDIMELIGTFPNRISGTIHWKSASGAATHQGADYNLSSGDYSQQFHVFSIVWQQDIIKWYVDDNLFLTKTASDLGGSTNPFNNDQFFLFNVAVGGNWPGPPDAGTIFPQRMFVDYVRVFQ